MDQTPLPTSIAEVENLIRALYSPQPPETIKHIQDVLQQIQKSGQGWQVARSLLSSSDQQVKFFGALTVIVRLNTDSSSLTDEDATKLIQDLVGCFVQCVEEDWGRLVLLKLCSALSTYFIHFSGLWKHCVRHIVYSLEAGRCLPLQDSDDLLSMPVSIAAPALSWQKLHASICFAASLAEDIDKTDLDSEKYAHLHHRLMENTQDVRDLLAVGFSDYQNRPGQKDIQENCIRCYEAWIGYNLRRKSDDTLTGLLRPLVLRLIPLISDEIMWDRTVEFLTEVINIYSWFFTEDLYLALQSTFGTDYFQARYRALVQGDFDRENVQFAFLMLAYGDARVWRLLESTDDQSQALLGGLAGLTGAAGYIAAEDKVFINAIEVWSNIVEAINDHDWVNENDWSTGGQDKPVWLSLAMTHINQVLSNCCRKIQWPPIETYVTWDSDERKEFVEARADVADLLQAVFTLSGIELVSWSVQLVLKYLNRESWAELEVSVFFLCSLADCISDDETYDELLGLVIAPPFFTLLGEAQGQVPLRLRHTSLSLIERYSEYFDRKPKFLAPALNLLFGALADSSLVGDAAKCIAKLCSSCRRLLTGEVPVFLEQFGAIYLRSPMDPVAEEKVVLAIASIIQAVGDESDRLRCVAQLFSCARMDVERAVKLAANPQALDLDNPLHRRGLDPSEPQAEVSPQGVSLQLALRALRFMNGMAKGLQSIREDPIDLDGDPVSPAQMSKELVMLQNEILTTTNQVLVTFPDNGEVIECTCSVFRAGFSETEPGPFVFAPDTVTSFFTSMTIASPRIGTVVSNACSYLSSLLKGPPIHLVPNISKLLPWVIGLLQALATPETDTEVAQNSIDFVCRLMTKCPEVIFQHQPGSQIEFFFLFTLQVLDGKEPLPKKAAAEFWTEFLSLKSADVELQAQISNATEALGPMVSRSLMRNIGGEASRSDLDRLSEPLKKLVVRQVGAQTWLESALFADDFPSVNVSLEEKGLFLKKIINLRGARQTNKVIKEFWLACRGLVG